jgi:hypothetical protein
VLGQVPVPHVQRADVALAAGPARAARRLQQRAALPQHPVVVRAHPGVPGRAQHQQLVQEPAALTGVAAHQRQILRREQHGAHDAQHVPRPGHRRPVHPGPVGPARGDLQFHGQLATGVHHRAADHGARGAVPHQRRVGGHPVRAEGGQVSDRFHQVRLALAVRPDQHTGPRLERQVGLRPGAEVGDLEVSDVHRGWVSWPAATRGPPRAPRARRTGCAAPRPPSSPASPPAGRRTGRTARPRSPAPAPRGRSPR